MGSVECSVQMFLFFLHHHKSYWLLSVCLIGLNLGHLFQDGVRKVLSVFFDYHCHVNILPSTGQENNIAQPKTDK